MKTLKEILAEASAAATSSQSSNNWSISAADLAKHAHDPSFVQKLKTPGRTSVDQLMKQVSPYISPNALANMSDEDIKLFTQRLVQHIDVVKSQAEKIKQQVSQEPGTKKHGSPASSDTMVKK